MTASAVAWLEPLRPAVAELSGLDLTRICDFEDALIQLLSAYPVGRGIDAGTRSQRLRTIRQSLAADGLLGLAMPARHGGCGHPPILQTLLQFTCGYHDVDLRDSTGLGHGQLIAHHATSQVRDRWLPRLLAGAVPGIAITEPHGGSQVHATRTNARPGPDGTWQVTGAKTWISRLTEAAVFCAFFTSPAGELTAALQYADGIHDSLYRSAGRDLVTRIPAGWVIPLQQDASAGSLAHVIPAHVAVPRPSKPGLLARQAEHQVAGLPFSSAATVLDSTASRHAAIRRASRGVTSAGTSLGGMNANPASSPSASTISST